MNDGDSSPITVYVGISKISVDLETIFTGEDSSLIIKHATWDNPSMPFALIADEFMESITDSAQLKPGDSFDCMGLPLEVVSREVRVGVWRVKRAEVAQ